MDQTPITPEAFESGGTPLPLCGVELDLQQVAQQIVELAQLAAVEHLDSIGRSQADGLYRLVHTTAQVKQNKKPAGTWR